MTSIACYPQVSISLILAVPYCFIVIKLGRISRTQYRLYVFWLGPNNQATVMRLILCELYGHSDYATTIERVGGVCCLATLLSGESHLLTCRGRMSKPYWGSSFLISSGLFHSSVLECNISVPASSIS